MRAGVGALTVLLAATAAAATPVPEFPVGAQEQPPDLAWAPGVSEVPLVDLSGTWVFLPDASDPMVEAWRDREIVYVITQATDRIVLDFRPEDGQRNLQGYRWDGSVSSFERGDAEVRERARWTDGGRTLMVEGRWWSPDDTGSITAYTFLYRLEGTNRLEFRQQDDQGETVWRFARR